jgi:hypothetical protein
MACWDRMVNLFRSMVFGIACNAQFTDHEVKPVEVSGCCIVYVPRCPMMSRLSDKLAGLPLICGSRLQAVTLLSSTTIRSLGIRRDSCRRSKGL